MLIVSTSLESFLLLRFSRLELYGHAILIYVSLATIAGSKEYSCKLILRVSVIRSYVEVS